MVHLIKSEQRGFTHASWLQSKYSFSFGDYYSAESMGFESLRVINEDVIAPGGGFGAHPHKNMEILTYVIEGAVKHQDSIGTEGVIRPGELQLMRAGLGIVHSEKNASESEKLHLLQIWIHPDERGLTPAYQQANFSNPLSKGEWVLLASPTARDHSLHLHQNVEVWSKRFLVDESLTKSFHQMPSSVWVQVVKGHLQVGARELMAGDGLGLKSQTEIAIDAKAGTEALFFVFRG